MLNAEHKQAMTELWNRYYTPDNTGISRSDRASIVTLDDIDMMSEAYQELSEDVRLFVELSKIIERQYARGERCGVCGQTAAQSAAIGYDCIHEC